MNGIKMATNVFFITFFSVISIGAHVCMGAPQHEDSSGTQSESEKRTVSAHTRRSIEEPNESIPDLDERINAEKITELPIPKVPKNIILPTPAIHRIAVDTSQSTLDSKSWEIGIGSITRGLTFLAATQSPRGAWFEGTEVIPTDQSPKEAAAAQAVTALALKAFAQAPQLTTSSLTQQRALQFIRNSIEEEGFDGLAKSGLGNYVTSSIVMGLAAVGSDSQLTQEGVEWLKGAQWEDKEGIRPQQDWYGGAGYGNRGRPDLSNTQFMLDALYDAGISPEEPNVQKALVFLSRTQNLKETNPAAWAQAGNNDGGFVYTPANDGESMASQAAGDGRYGENIPSTQPRTLRSYGSMTYAGFKSLLYAGLSQDDPRVHAALEWTRDHWTLNENPGVGQQGYFYYLHALARALRASGLDTITDSKGIPHDWRKELITALSARQRADGSWLNSEDRWEEGQADLATTYAVLALEEALKPNRDSE